MRTRDCLKGVRTTKGHDTIEIPDDMHCFRCLYENEVCIVPETDGARGALPLDTRRAAYLRETGIPAGHPLDVEILLPL